jgi:hypothetical protein
MAVINCEANSAAITGGQTADNIPTAGFVTFFMNEPVPLPVRPVGTSLEK